MGTIIYIWEVSDMQNRIKTMDTLCQFQERVCNFAYCYKRLEFGLRREYKFYPLHITTHTPNTILLAKQAQYFTIQIQLSTPNKQY